MEEVRKEGFFTRLGKGIKYRIRKFGIAIYHNPYTVVLLLAAVSMMFYTFNFQKIAFELTEGLISGVSNGFLAFLWTLSAYLSVVSYLFYSGKKKNWVMFGVFILLEIAQLYSSIFYSTEGSKALANRLAENPNLEPERIASAERVLNICKTATVFIVIVIVLSIVVIFLDRLFIKQRKAIYEAKKAARLQKK